MFAVRVSANHWRSLSRLWLFVVFCLISPASAQYSFEGWTADDGLPQSIISGIRQTPDGYLWLATYDGLVRFDGVRFTVFDKSNSPGIKSNRFASLYEDSDGDLWLVTETSGLTCYRRGSFTTYTTEQGLPHNDVRAITSDEAGNLAINNNTAPGGVFNNDVNKNLSCGSNTSITGDGNTAESKRGQCAKF